MAARWDVDTTVSLGAAALSGSRLPAGSDLVGRTQNPSRDKTWGHQPWAPAVIVWFKQGEGAYGDSPNGGAIEVCEAPHSEAHSEARLTGSEAG